MAIRIINELTEEWQKRGVEKGAVFAFLDYEKAGALVLLENILMLLFFGFIGNLVAVLYKKNSSADRSKMD